jgi:hypothetical protein
MGLALMGLAGSSRAEAPPVHAPTADAEARAKDLFVQAMSLHEAGRVAEALELLLQSHALRPSKGNTTNAANCLEKLARYDEALDLYEEAYFDFKDQLNQDNRDQITKTIDDLKALVGGVKIVANVPDLLVTEGKRRRHLRSGERLHLLPGNHTLQIEASGYFQSLERVEVRLREIATSTVALVPTSPRLRVEEDSTAPPGADVFVDSARVGSTPWEGPVAVGPHVIWIVRGEVGSGPVRVLTPDHTTTRAQAEASPLGPPFNIEVEPSSASLTLDDVPLGRGQWTGRLPLGAHVVVGSEIGYGSELRRLQVRPDAPEPSVHLMLAMDHAHPRWPPEKKFHFGFGVFGGAAIGSSLGSSIESVCPDACTQRSPAVGFAGGLRADVRFPFELSLELEGGWLSLHTHVNRRLQQSFSPNPAVFTYDLDDQLSFKGPFLAAGLSRRFAVGSRLWLLGRLMAGVVFASARDPVTGTVTGGNETVPVTVLGSKATVHLGDAFILPEIGVGGQLGPLDVGVGLALGAFFADGPLLGNGSTNAAVATCTPANPAAGSCAQISSVAANDRAFGPFFSVIPQVSLGYSLR